MNNQKEKVRVLVAEDETIIRLDLVEMLTEAGYEVVAQAENGAIAIELAKEFKPDLAILDVKMPVVDGITAAEQIIPIAPVLMLTAFSQRELVERARDAGVMAYVVGESEQRMHTKATIRAVETAVENQDKGHWCGARRDDMTPSKP